MHGTTHRGQQDADLMRRIRVLLDDPAHHDNPLYAPLAELQQHTHELRERLQRLVRISDGYHEATRSRNLSLVEEYDKQIQRLGKLARISDRYQEHLRKLNESLKEVALRDPLTGLGNRRLLMERLRAERERAQRTGLTFSVAILDVDHFKSVNDRFGHETGDQVLCAIAGAIQSALREYDLCGRWGGEEFLLMLPDTRLETAVGICERVRCTIADMPLQQEGRAIAVSASFGLTDYHDGEHYSDTVNRADTALLKAKGGGRNRLEIA